MVRDKKMSYSGIEASVLSVLETIQSKGGPISFEKIIKELRFFGMNYSMNAVKIAFRNLIKKGLLIEEKDETFIVRTTAIPRNFHSL